MKYYIDTVVNKVYAYEPDGSQDALITADMVAMTPDQVAAHINPPKDPKLVALSQIRALEAQYADAQAKLTRQVILSQALDKAMTYPEAAGLTREQVHADLMVINGGNTGYATLFTLEQHVATLRAQL